LLELSLGDWAHPDGKKLYNWLEHSQKKMAAVWAGHKIKLVSV
jgi:hypothetical protein